MTKSRGGALALLPVLLFGLHSAFAASGEDAGATARRVLEVLDARVPELMERDGTPGVSLAITDRNGLAGTGTWGYADLTTKQPVTDDTLFQIGSITKSFTALALLAAQEEGKVDLKKPLTEYLPWFSVHTEFQPLTAHDLLTHTAGIPGNRDDIFNSPYMAAALSQQHTAWAPGERYYYSNVGYQVLHELLLTVTGEAYEDIIRERFFGPLGMTHSNPTIRLESRDQQSVAYVSPYDDRPSDRSRPLVEAQLLEYAIGDGCIQATAGDLAAYARLWLNRGAAGDKRVVSPESFDKFATIYPGTTEPGEPDDGYGYGVNVHERDGSEPLLAHSGGMVGQHAYAAADLRDGHGVAVLINGPGSPTEIGTLALEIWRALDAGQAPPEPEADAEDVVEAGDYAGTFSAADGAKLEFGAQGGDLVLVHGGERIALDSRDTDVFYTPAAGLDRYYFYFGRNDEDEVVEVSHGSSWYVNSDYEGEMRFDVPDEWAAYTGQYRNYSPWFAYFEVLVHKDGLWLYTGEGGESDSGGTRLVPIGPQRFRIGEDKSPEVLEFHDLVDGRALRATHSGHVFFRQH